MQLNGDISQNCANKKHSNRCLWPTVFFFSFLYSFTVSLTFITCAAILEEVGTPSFDQRDVSDQIVMNGQRFYIKSGDAVCLLFVSRFVD